MHQLPQTPALAPAGRARSRVRGSLTPSGPVPRKPAHFGSGAKDGSKASMCRLRSRLISAPGHGPAEPVPKKTGLGSQPACPGVGEAGRFCVWVLVERKIWPKNLR